MNERINIQIIRDVYAAFNRGDIAAALSRLDPQADLHFEGSPDVPWSGNRTGIEGWTDFFRAVGDAMENCQIDMQPFAAQDDRVVFAGRYTARVKATGKLIDSPIVHLWIIRNDEIIHCQELTNTAAEAEACMAGVAAASR